MDIDQNDAAAGIPPPVRPGRQRHRQTAAQAVPRRSRPNPRPRIQARHTEEDRPPAGEPRAEARADSRGGDAPPREGRLTRQRPEGAYSFSIDKAIVPPGFTYEWKRASYMGKADLRHQQSLKLNHWTPVPASRHPELASEDPLGAVIVDGMMMMERPAYLTKEAREESYAAAVNQVRSVADRLGETPQGTLTRGHASAKANTHISKTFEAFDSSRVSE